MSASESVLYLQAGTYGCALRVSEVVEIMRPLPIAPLSGLPGWLRGLALVRGEPLPVVDLGWLLGGTPSSIGRMVTVQTGQQRLSLGVSHVSSIGTLDALKFSALPPLLGPTSAQALGAHAGELLQLLESARLLSEDVQRALDVAIGQGPA